MAVLETIRDEDLQRNAAEVGLHLRRALAELAERFAQIGDVRGAGFFIGVEVVWDRATRQPDAATTSRIVNGLRERRVLISASGPGANVLKIRPPMVFSKDDADTFVEALGDTLDAL